MAVCVRSSSGTPTTSTRGSSATASASAATPSPSCTARRPTTGRALDGIDLVLTLGSEWNVYRPETRPAGRGRGGARAPGRGRRLPAARHLLRGPGAVPRPRWHRHAAHRRRRSAGSSSTSTPASLPADRGWSGTTTCSPSPRASPSSPGRPSGRSSIAQRGGCWPPSSTPRRPTAMVTRWMADGGAEQLQAAGSRPRRPAGRDPGQHRRQPGARRRARRLVPDRPVAAQTRRSSLGVVTAGLVASRAMSSFLRDYLTVVWFGLAALLLGGLLLGRRRRSSGPTARTPRS